MKTELKIGTKDTANEVLGNIMTRA